MNHRTRTTLALGAILAGALWMLGSCKETGTVAQVGANPPGRQSAPASHHVTSGTTITVSLGNSISSKTAGVGDAWHGSVTENVSTQNGGMIAAGSEVRGVVTGVSPAKRGSRAMLDLGIRGIRVNGHDESITANAEPVIAGSTRARNLGAIAGAAAAGALIGKAVGDGRNATVGAIIGGGAATGVVATSDGYQVVLPVGAVMSFTVSQTMAMR